MANLVAVRDWVGMSAAAFTAFEHVIGDLSNSLRNLALLQPNHIRMAVESARVQPATGDARSLTVVETSQVGLIWRIAKMKTLRAGGTAWDEIVVEDPMIVAEKRQAPPAAEPGVGQSHKKIKMANVIDQTDDSELATDG
eukprot:4069621-Amphidinium_carterae.1